MRHGKSTTGLVLGAFSAALTVLPWLHTLHHRDDHIHVDGAIVFDHHHADADVIGDVDVDVDVDVDDPSPGFDHPPHHAPHGRGALAHGSAFILAGIVYLFPAPAVALDAPPPPSLPDPPPPAAHRSPRVTRGPPRAA